MDARQLAAELSDVERAVLSALVEHQTLPDPRQAAGQLVPGLSEDALRRAYQWLSAKNLATLDVKKDRKLTLSARGLDARQNGLPENRLLDALADNELDLATLSAKTGLSPAETGVALGANKKLGFVTVQNGRAKRTGLDAEFARERSKKHRLLAHLDEWNEADADEEERVWIREFRERGLLEEKTTGEQRLSLTEFGIRVHAELKNVGARAFSVSEPVARLPHGTAQPYYRFLRDVRRKLTELGFVEMDAPVVTTEFYNFDVLFQPQNHPARTWTDTYTLGYPKTGLLPDAKIVDAIARAHENGGKTKSKGWGYTWNPKIASRLMPAAHGTAHSARTLALGVQTPAKYFTIARCFRPDVIDAKHLQEFNQLEGIIIGKDLAFTHLLGMLDQFAREIAHASDVSFTPSYYPFTEPSVQLNAKHPQLGWIELGGAGIFRPEMTENLGYSEPVLAWGLGIDRLAMFALELRDIRQLFSNDLKWLADQPWRNI